MNRRMIVCLMMTVGVFALLVGTAEAGLIYFDDFSGSSSAQLNGTAPDVRPGSETWTASITAPTWMADGSFTGGSTSSNAWLPFTPQGGTIYKLSITMDPTIATQGNWFAVGFAQANSTVNGFQTSPDPNPAPWALKRGQAGSPGVPYEVYSFLGPATASGVSHGAYMGPTEFLIQLDTRGSLWTAEWFVNGTSVRGPVAYGTNPTINYVGFGRYADTSGVVDNFRLEAVPEPATWVLLTTGLAGLAVCALQGRRRPKK